MRVLRVFVAILAFISVLCTAGMYAVQKTKSEPPVITNVSGSNMIEVPCSVTDEELLKLVTAYDEKDGDLTDKITVRRNTYFTQSGVVGVTFAVCDSDNNVAKLSFDIKFTDYSSPEIAIVNDLVIGRRTGGSLLAHFKATDKLDGDITDRLKIISSDYDVNNVGEYTANCKVTNSYGDTRDMNVSILVADTTKFTADIQLSSYSVYVPLGTQLDFASYISAVKNIEGYSYTTANVEIDASKYDPSTAGIYNVYYRITKGEITEGLTRLFVIVENGEG